MGGTPKENSWIMLFIASSIEALSRAFIPTTEIPWRKIKELFRIKAVIKESRKIRIKRLGDGIKEFTGCGLGFYSVY